MLQPITLKGDSIFAVPRAYTLFAGCEFGRDSLQQFVDLNNELAHRNRQRCCDHCWGTFPPTVRVFTIELVEIIMLLREAWDIVGFYNAEYVGVHLVCWNKAHDEVRQRRRIHAFTVVASLSYALPAGYRKMILPVQHRGHEPLVSKS